MFILVYYPLTHPSLRNSKTVSRVFFLHLAAYFICIVHAFLFYKQEYFIVFIFSYILKIKTMSDLSSTEDDVGIMELKYVFNNYYYLGH